MLILREYGVRVIGLVRRLFKNKLRGEVPRPAAGTEAGKNCDAHKAELKAGGNRQGKRPLVARWSRVIFGIIYCE